jgi:hypothetical protein
MTIGLDGIKAHDPSISLNFRLNCSRGLKALMLVPFAQVYNALCLGLPAYDPDRDAVVISEPSVELSHTFSAWPLKSPTTH